MLRDRDNENQMEVTAADPHEMVIRKERLAADEGETHDQEPTAKEDRRGSWLTASPIA